MEQTAWIYTPPLFFLLYTDDLVGNSGGEGNESTRLRRRDFHRGGQSEGSRSLALRGGVEFPPLRAFYLSFFHFLTRFNQEHAKRLAEEAKYPISWWRQLTILTRRSFTNNRGALDGFGMAQAR
jgi:hypothetical protein